MEENAMSHEQEQESPHGLGCTPLLKLVVVCVTSNTKSAFHYKE